MGSVAYSTFYLLMHAVINFSIGQFTSINAGWPGSAHDSHVLRVSNLCRHLEAHHHGIYLHSVCKSCKPDAFYLNLL